MPIFSRQLVQPEYILQLSDQCGGKLLEANQTSKILEARLNRRTIEITNPSNSIVTVGLQVNAENEITVKQVTLEPRDHYEFPASGDGAMYI
jgi:P pilus assembly chaperone PapD